MLFNTWAFALFFIFVWCFYAILSTRWQNRMLLVASYVFYGMWDWRFCSLLLISTSIDYWMGLRIHASENDSTRKKFLLVSLVVNLGILGFFKYFNFFADSAVDLLSRLGFNADYVTLNIVLPVGISFYTFQTLSYTIDVYRRQFEPIRDPVAYGLFVSYFPLKGAGPIERARCFLPRITQPRTITAENLASGGFLILIGLIRKVAIADNLAPYVNEFFSVPGDHSSIGLTLGLLMFALQIYNDFAGYSDIASGVSRMFGIELMENFHQPYFATSITTFWRRWHISLSSWLRDYLYIPLGGNRGPTWSVYRNLMLTMLLGGLWHGAAWTFVIWGGLHGIALVLNRVWSYFHGISPMSTSQKIWRIPLGWSMTMLVVLIGWVFFRAPNFETALQYLSGIGSLHFTGEAIKTPLILFTATLVLMLSIDIPQAVTRNQTIMLRWPALVRGMIYAGLILILVIFRSEADVPFIYFQF